MAGPSVGWLWLPGKVLHRAWVHHRISLCRITLALVVRALVKVTTTTATSLENEFPLQITSTHPILTASYRCFLTAAPNSCTWPATHTRTGKRRTRSHSHISTVGVTPLQSCGGEYGDTSLSFSSSSNLKGRLPQRG